MITIKQFMEVVEYRITEGSAWAWPCFGPQAQPYTLAAWNGDYEGWSMNIVFDTGTQQVYLAEACDYRLQRAYRRVNPDWALQYRDYAQSQGERTDQAWDLVDFVDLETDDDWIEKALAIRAGRDYDTRISVPVTLTDDELYSLMQQAHARDITLNQLVTEILDRAVQERTQ